MKKATLCYIRRQDDAGWEYLMLYRNKKQNDPNEGKWIGVGGKFEPGETPDECMLREVREETGLTLSKYHFCGVIHFLSDTWEDEDMYLYRAEAGAPIDAPFRDGAAGTLAGDSAVDGAVGAAVARETVLQGETDELALDCDEGELRWIPEEQIMDLPMWEGDRLFLKPLLEGAERISMTLRYEGDTLVSYQTE